MAKVKRKASTLDVENNIHLETIEQTEFGDEIKDSILNYAIEIITDRALPDVHDGLKPIQRRILYAGLANKYLASGKFVKCAKYVGDVIGTFSPHGLCIPTMW